MFEIITRWLFLLLFRLTKKKDLYFASVSINSDGKLFYCSVRVFLVTLGSLNTHENEYIC